MSEAVKAAWARGNGRSMNENDRLVLSEATARAWASGRMNPSPEARKRMGHSETQLGVPRTGDAKAAVSAGMSRYWDDVRSGKIQRKSKKHKEVTE